MLVETLCHRQDMLMDAPHVCAFSSRDYHVLHERRRLSHSADTVKAVIGSKIMKTRYLRQWFYGNETSSKLT